MPPQTLSQIASNSDALGQAVASGAGATWGPVSIFPPLRGSGRAARGRTFFVRLAGTAYTALTLKGRLDPDDAGGWVDAIDFNLNPIFVSPSVPAQHWVLGADYAELEIVATGGAGDSQITGLLGP